MGTSALRHTPQFLEAPSRVEQQVPSVGVRDEKPPLKEVQGQWIEAKALLSNKMQKVRLFNSHLEKHETGLWLDALMGRIALDLCLAMKLLHNDAECLHLLGNNGWVRGPVTPSGTGKLTLMHAVCHAQDLFLGSAPHIPQWGWSYHLTHFTDNDKTHEVTCPRSHGHLGLERHSRQKANSERTK